MPKGKNAEHAAGRPPARLPILVVGTYPDPGAVGFVGYVEPKRGNHRSQRWSILIDLEGNPSVVVDRPAATVGQGMRGVHSMPAVEIGSYFQPSAEAVQSDRRIPVGWIAAEDAAWCAFVYADGSVSLF